MFSGFDAVALCLLDRSRTSTWRHAYRFFTGRVSQVLWVSLCCWLSLSGGAWADDDFDPPDRGLPGQRRGGGTRTDDACVVSQGTPLTTLVPRSNLGLTQEPYPTLFWYMPEHQASLVEVGVYAVDDRFEPQTLLFQTQFHSSGQSGIASLQLPPTLGLEPLQAGQTYSWYVSLVCHPDDRLKDVVASGWLEEMNPVSPGPESLQATPSLDRAKELAQQGIWYDSLATLTQLICDPRHPNQGEARRQLNDLLSHNDVELSDLVDQPLLMNCDP